MRLINKKSKARLVRLAAVLAVVFSLCLCTYLNASAIKGFNSTIVSDFRAEAEKTYSKPKGSSVAAGTLSWKLYDSAVSTWNSDGLQISEGYIMLAKNNPVNMSEGFMIDIVYTSYAEEGAAGNKAFLMTSDKTYTSNQPVTDPFTTLGITENGDVYFGGNKVNHKDGAKADDILTARNAKINAGDECKLTLRYTEGKLSITLASGSLKSTLLSNYSCEIFALRQFILGGDKSSRLDGITYKTVSFSDYGDYVPQMQEGLKAVVQSGENCCEYDNMDTALSDTKAKAAKGENPVIMLYDDMTLKKPITVDGKAPFTVDLNGHTINRNCQGIMASDGYVFLLNEGASLVVEDSSPDAANYSSGIRGGVITGGAGDDVGGGFQMSKNSKLTMKGGSVVGCVTNDHGGAIRVAGDGVKISISNAGFYTNMTYDSTDNSHGGAIYADYENCEINISDSIFEGNYSEDNGGAIYVNDGRLAADNCVFAENKCLDDGGAVYVERDSTVSFDNCRFTGNSADGDGGAVYCNSSDGTRLSGKFTGNSCGGNGGAVYVNGDAVCIADAQIKGNSSSDFGGGVYVDEMYDLNVQGLLIVRDNKSSKNAKDDIFLDDAIAASAHIYDGGLYDGSELWVLTDDSNHTVCENISEYQQKFFFSDNSSKRTNFEADSSKTEKQSLIASAVGNGSVIFIAVCAAAAVIAAVIAVIVKKHKKGADKNEK